MFFLSELGQDEEAVSIAREIVALDPGDFHAENPDADIHPEGMKNWCLGHASRVIAEYHYMNGRLNDAESMCRVACDSDDRQCYFVRDLLAGILVARERPEEAVAVLRNADCYSGCDFELGEAYHKLGRFDDAVAAFRASIRRGHVSIGGTFGIRRWRGHAVSIYQRLSLALSELRVSNNAGAIQAAEEALQLLREKTAFALLVLALGHAAEGDGPEAKALYEEAVTLLDGTEHAEPYLTALLLEAAEVLQLDTDHGTSP